MCLYKFPGANTKVTNGGDGGGACGCDCGGLLDGDGCGLGADGSHGGMVGCLVGSFLCLQVDCINKSNVVLQMEKKRQN